MAYSTVVRDGSRYSCWVCFWTSLDVFMVRGQVFDEELWALEKRGEAAQNLKLSIDIITVERAPPNKGCDWSVATKPATPKFCA